MHMQIGGRAIAKCWTRRLTATALVGFALAAPPLEAAAQSPPTPSVQVICEVSGPTATTVRVIYPAGPVSRVHGFYPLSSGPPLFFHPPATATQVYSFAVPAGSYKMRHAVPPSLGGVPPYLLPYNPLIVIPPFKVVGRMCERSQVIGRPSS